MNEVLQKLSDIGIVPVVVLNDARNAVPLARALAAGGIPAAEITFRTAAARDAIAAVACEVPQVLVGAGTVTSAEMAQQAVEGVDDEAGAVTRGGRHPRQAEGGAIEVTSCHGVLHDAGASPLGEQLLGPADRFLAAHADATDPLFERNAERVWQSVKPGHPPVQDGNPTGDLDIRVEIAVAQLCELPLEVDHLVLQDGGDHLVASGEVPVERSGAHARAAGDAVE